MPQGRRKTPFSGKQKKVQLITKRQRKGGRCIDKNTYSDSDDSNDEEAATTKVQDANPRPSRGSRPNRYALQFFKESDKDIALLRHAAMEPLVRVERKEREIGATFFEGYDFPIRPPWNYSMSKEELDRNENRYFTDYTRKLEERHNKEEKQLSLFELNLETWRQLWRVLEISDIVLIIVDIRFAVLMFPPALFDHIKNTLKKDVILVLNKVDLVRPELVVAWKQYFLETYPGISVTMFSSYRARKTDNLKVSKRKPKINGGGECALDLYKCVKSIVGTDLDLSKWEEKILEDIASHRLGDMDEDVNVECVAKPETFDFEEHVKYRNGVVTIGCVGFPNVGKSSVINALKGRKVVSVSRTPGHTKYFQTIFLTDNVKLCDCPGLVFPSATPKSLQVILGSFPIAQLRVPYGSIRYVAERLDLPYFLSIELPACYEEWSPLGICEAWAFKRGFLTAKAARPDTYRAANNILQLVLQGKIVLDFYPVGFLEKENEWKNHPDVDEIRKMQAAESEVSDAPDPYNSTHSDSESNSNNSSEEGFEADDSADMKRSENVFSLLSEG